MDYSSDIDRSDIESSSSTVVFSRSDNFVDVEISLHRHFSDTDSIFITATMVETIHGTHCILFLILRGLKP